jgi:hypothetical protein
MNSLNPDPRTLLQHLRVFFVYFRRELSKTWKSMAAVLLIFASISLLMVSLANPAEGKEAYFSPPAIQFSFSLIDEDDSIIGSALKENLIDVRYVREIFDDDLETAMQRLEDGEILLAMQLPDTLLTAARIGSGHEPINIWLSPHMKADAARVTALLRQYSIAVNLIHSTSFGFQSIYEDLTGDADRAWKETTSHAVSSVMTVIEREGFVQESEEPPFDLFFHAIAGILILLSLVPGILILVQTSRLRGTALEDRLLLSAGPTIPVLSRLLIGIIWWLILTGPIFLSLNSMLAEADLRPAVLVLFTGFLATALVMMALGRTSLPTITSFSLGWVIVFALILTGGILYPNTLFPDWLRRIFSFTPLHYTMKVVYGSLMGAKIETAKILLAMWPLSPALLLGAFKGRRCV